jgi:hypothetical protein
VFMCEGVWGGGGRGRFPGSVLDFLDNMVHIVFNVVLRVFDTRNVDHNKLSKPSWSLQLLSVIRFKDTGDGEFVVLFSIIFHT